MKPLDRTADPRAIDTRRLLAYVAELELEVDRLRRHRQFFEQQERELIGHILRLCTAPKDGDPLPTLAEVDQTARHLTEVARDLHEPPGYHPSHDQVVAIALRPLVEQEFRTQCRLAGDMEVTLRLELETDYVEWFPARLRHILDNLISNALKYRDPDKDQRWVVLAVRASAECYEFRIADNGIGMHPSEREQVFQLFYRAAPARAAGMGLGLSVVKLLVEQSGGEVKAESVEGEGSSFVAMLPRYPLNDFLV